MRASENTTILAVPCDQPIILNPEQAKELLGTIKENRTAKKDIGKLEQDVKILFTKPDRK